MKKIIFSLGSLLVATSPLVMSISCSSPQSILVAYEVRMYGTIVEINNEDNTYNIDSTYFMTIDDVSEKTGAWDNMSKISFGMNELGTQSFEYKDVFIGKRVNQHKDGYTYDLYFEIKEIR